MRGDGRRRGQRVTAPSDPVADLSPEYVAQLATVVRDVQSVLGDRGGWLADLELRGFGPSDLTALLPTIVGTVPERWWLARDLLHRVSDELDGAPVPRVPARYVLTLECTGRDGHNPTPVGDVTVSGGDRALSGPGLWAPDPTAAPGSRRSRASITARCPTCGCTQQRLPDAWWRGCDWLASLGVARVDLSRFGS